MYLDQGYAIPREIPDNYDFLSQFWPILLSRKYLCIDFTENFQNFRKNRGGEFLTFPHCAVGTVHCGNYGNLLSPIIFFVISLRYLIMYNSLVKKLL